MQKGIQRVHKKLIHEHKQLAKELDEYHKLIVKGLVKNIEGCTKDKSG